MNFCNGLALMVVLEQISGEKGLRNKNVVTSPLSLNAVLNMVAAASKGGTLAQLLEALEARSIEELNLKFSKIMDLALPDNDDNNNGGGPLLSIVNGVWADLRCPLKPSFEEAVKKYYKADTQTVDFVNKAAQVVKEVNIWIENETKGLIKDLPLLFTSDTMIMLVNALYFKGAWKDAFEKFRTRDEDFHLLNGETIKVPFMKSQTDEYHIYGSFDGFKVLKLPYRSGGDDQCFPSNLNRQHSSNLFRAINPNVPPFMANNSNEQYGNNSFMGSKPNQQHYYSSPSMVSKPNEQYGNGPFMGSKPNQQHYNSPFMANNSNEQYGNNSFMGSKPSQQHYYSSPSMVSKPNEQYGNGPFMGSKPNQQHYNSPFMANNSNEQYGNNSFMGSKPNQQHYYSSPSMVSKPNEQYGYGPFMGSKPNQQHYNSPFMASKTNEQQHYYTPFMASKPNQQYYNDPFLGSKPNQQQQYNSSSFMASKTNEQHYYTPNSIASNTNIRVEVKGPVEDKRRFSMYVFLPDERNGLENLLKKLNSEPSLLHQQCDDKLGEVKLDKMWLPKFKFSYTFSPSSAMSELGIDLPFMPVGELTEMVDSSNSEEVFISDIIQKACIEVNEEGTEAAAVTICTLAGCSMMRPPPPPSFVADHPFLFMIKEEVSGVVFFTGAVLNPLLA